MNTDYLKYQASSIQELLRRKLMESGILTDQLYPSSDTKIVIDLFSWTFDVLTYILNNNISDALFSDTYLYENINRLVKLLSYNPLGYRTSQCQFKIGINQSQINNLKKIQDIIYIPKYTYVNSGKVDSNGNDICYSFVQSYILNIYNYTSSDGKQNIKIITPKMWPILYNGKYKKYIQTFIANGVQYDFHILKLLDLTSQNKIYVDHNLFQVYTQIIDENTGKKKYIQWKKTDNLILNATQNDYMFQMRLNQNKQYVLKFGNGTHGKIPEYGSYIHILYFQSNGQQGIIDVKQIDVNILQLNIQGFSTNIQMFNMLFENIQNFKQLYGNLFITNNLYSQKCSKLTFLNTNQSSTPKTFEDVQSIRQNAPLAYKRGQRLITEQDFQSYIKQNYGSIVHDIFVANNNFYISTFYKWLNKYNKLNVGIRQFYYKYADSCDFNNIYLWLVSSGVSNISAGNLDIIIRDCNKVKCATAQLIPLNAITTKFIPFIEHSKKQFSYKENNISLDQYLSRIKIYIYKKQNALITNQKLRQLVNNKIVSYFAKQNQKIGATINLFDITAQLINLNYITSIKTVNIPQNNKNEIQYVNGLSFAAYTTQLVTNLDFTVFTTAYNLQKFQFPQLYSKNILNMIQIIDNTYNITSTEL